MDTNYFFDNWAAYGGGVLYLRRYSKSWAENECGAIYIYNNTLDQNWGCGWSVGPIDIFCYAHSNIELEFDKMEAGDLTNYHSNPISGPSNLASATLPFDSHKIVIQENVFFFNFGAISNAILVYGAKSVLVKWNLFQNNGPFHQDLVDYLSERHPVYYYANASYWAYDDNKIAKEVFKKLS
jgi:hypothetical protein